MNEKVETATTSKLKTLRLSKYRESKKFILSSRTLWDYVLPVDPICWITDPLFSSKPQGFETFWGITMDFVSNCNSFSEERKKCQLVSALSSPCSDNKFSQRTLVLNDINWIPRFSPHNTWYHSSNNSEQHWLLIIERTVVGEMFSWRGWWS